MSLFDILGTLLIGPLKLLFEVIYSFALRFIASPGLAIIALSLVMNVLVLPLYRRADAIQMEARDTENRLNPVITHIKKTFSGDERMMILQTYYRQNNYNPLSVLSSSISLLLQIPFFMAAYQFLSGLEILNGVPFGPIADLSKPDGLLVIGGFTVNLLPIIMTLVNVISSSLYLKGFSLKNKIQLYGMAAFFLVFLYNSPSALVFYWTLNNVFSLIKTIFYKLKHAKTILGILVGVVGVGLIISSLFVEGLRSKLFIAFLGAAMQLVWVLPLLKTRYALLQKAQDCPKPNTRHFILGALFLTVLIGLLIPSTYVSASPQEYIDAYYFYNPVWYVVQTLCLAAGTFLVWLSVFYWLASPSGKVIFSRLVWIMGGVMLVNYMFFGTNLGILSPNLYYTEGFSFSAIEQLINIAVVIILAVALFFIAKKFSRAITAVLLAGAIALSGMSAINFVKIASAAEDTKTQLASSTDTLPSFSLSQNGKNVVVIMLDRGIGSFVPYIMEENPALIEKFDGFVHYSNTLSYGGFTNFGTPPLYGGYEYTPVNMNKRSSELLVDKHNEALKVMPTIFSKENYNVTLIDPSYAGYTWIPDVSIFKDIPRVSAYLADGRFSNPEDRIATINARKRNFFFFSLMKTLPVSLQSVLYNEGAYRTVKSDGTDTSGVLPAFMNAYNVMRNLNNMTKITSGDENTFMFWRSNITHEAVLLQEPTFTPSSTIDNSAYYSADGRTITAGGNSVTLKNDDAIAHYHANMSALMQLGDWFDSLRDAGVYDNTRIIIVSDHGQPLNIFSTAEDGKYNIESYIPMLLVKDFGAHGFSTSTEFMTNADVPTLAMNGLVNSPVNPFTGNPITNAAKSGKQYVILSRDWDVTKNNGNQFLPSEWGEVSGTVSNKESWTFYKQTALFPQGTEN